MNALFSQMVGAARLDGDTYETVEARSQDSRRALCVVLLASVAAAIGSGVTDLASILGITVAALLTWMLWVFLTYIVGTRLLSVPETRTSFGELFRTTGFSASPGILRALGVVPVIGWPIFMASTVWMLFAFVVAVRHALDFSSSRRAFAVCLLTWLIHGVVFFAFVLTAI
jgi:hypothetical protein